MTRLFLIVGLALIASGCGESDEVTTVEKSPPVVAAPPGLGTYQGDVPSIYVDANGCQYLVFESSSPGAYAKSVVPRMAWSRSGAKNFQIGCRLTEDLQ